MVFRSFFLEARGHFQWAAVTAVQVAALEVVGVEVGQNIAELRHNLVFSAKTLVFARILRTEHIFGER